MFTGIIEEMGTIVSVRKEEDVILWDGTRGSSFVLIVRAVEALKGIYIGCSIAVNGVCLTVTAYDEQTFTVNCAPETLRLTNLRDVSHGSSVNLERSMRADDRNSGHFVQGHIDDTGDILSFTPDGDSLRVKIKVPQRLIKYIVAKGYVAIDGTSLTVCEVNVAEHWFTVMLIAFTQKKIVLPQRHVGDMVNIEVDMFAKYTERAVERFEGELLALQQQQIQTKRLATAALLIAVVTTAFVKFNIS